METSAAGCTAEHLPTSLCTRVAAALHFWFLEHGRDYPWRRTTDPYAILVSEVMLQQTRIATVLGRGYYGNWMAAFPDVTALAEASEKEVLRAWEGLGYYSRARNLQKTAQAVCQLPGAAFPRTERELLALPGIGRYTAGALLSFAWNLPAPVVDGNVMRVLARLLGCYDPVDQSPTRELLWNWAGQLLSQSDPRIHNSALMELGQQICTPGRPACLLCPLQEHCLSAGPAAAALPVKSPARAVIPLTEHTIFAYRKHEVLLHQEQGSRRRGLWKFPSRTEQECAGLPLVLKSQYTITHYRVTLRVYSDPGTEARQGETWHPKTDLASLPMPGPFRRALDELLSATP